MRVGVFGAGAVGMLVAARLARAGVDVGLVARGDTRAVIADRGIEVEDRSGRWTARPTRCGTAEDVGPCDAVVVAVKAHVLPAATEALLPLLTSRTSVLFALNGVPWWYFHRHPSWSHSPHLESVDPEGAVWKSVGPERAAGCVVHLGASVPAPGRVKHAYGTRLVLGSTAESGPVRVDAFGDALAKAGFRVETPFDIRTEVWRKLWYNMAINPMSVVTGSTCDRIVAQPALVRIMEQMVDEGAGVARATGVTHPVDAREQVRGFAAIGAFKTSMLQDLEAGRSIEIEPILGAVAEIGRRCGVDTPRVDEVLALARLRAASVEMPEPAHGAGRGSAA